MTPCQVGLTLPGVGTGGTRGGGQGSLGSGQGAWGSLPALGWGDVRGLAGAEWDFKA